MDAHLLFVIVIAVLAFIIIIFDLKYNLLRDKSIAVKKPFSYSRTQLAWWTVVVLASFITIIFSNKGYQVPTFDTSTLILLGISTSTMMTARIIDVSDEQRVDHERHQDAEGKGVLLDILSDENGVSIHRLQSVVFNLTFGTWFIIQVWNNLELANDISKIIPVITQNNLILIGLSSGTYAALKSTENKTASVTSSSQPADSRSDIPPVG